MLGNPFCCAQLVDTTVLDYHPGDVRGAEPRVRLPLVARCLLEEAWLDGAAEEGVYVALWRSSADP